MHTNRSVDNNTGIQVEELQIMRKDSNKEEGMENKEQVVGMQQ